MNSSDNKYRMVQTPNLWCAVTQYYGGGDERRNKVLASACLPDDSARHFPPESLVMGEYNCLVGEGSRCVGQYTPSTPTPRQSSIKH